MGDNKWHDQWNLSAVIPAETVSTRYEKNKKCYTTVSRCTNYTDKIKTDASGKEWPPVVWQSYIPYITTISAVPKYTGGPYRGEFNGATRYYDALAQETCTLHTTGGISYSTISTNDVVATSPVNSIVRSVNNELTRRGLTSSVSTVSTGTETYAKSLAAIGNAIRNYAEQYNTVSNDWFGSLQWDTKSIVTPNKSDIIYANQPTSMTNVLSCMIRECVCYTDCISYYICRCYDHCNHY